MHVATPVILQTGGSGLTLLWTCRVSLGSLGPFPALPCSVAQDALPWLSLGRWPCCSSCRSLPAGPSDSHTSVSAISYPSLLRHTHHPAEQPSVAVTSHLCVPPLQGIREAGPFLSWAWLTSETQQLSS